MEAFYGLVHINLGVYQDHASIPELIQCQNVEHFYLKQLWKIKFSNSNVLILPSSVPVGKFSASQVDLTLALYIVVNERLPM